MSAERKKRQHHNSDGNILNVDVVDLILMDHKILKKGIAILTDDDADKKTKLAAAQEFLAAVHDHSLAEKRAIYTPLESNEELHFNILEAEIEHGIVDQKVKMLKGKLSRVRTLKDELEAELKVLAELVKHHLQEEESEMLPKMKEAVDDQTLIELGAAFMKLRKWSNEDFGEFPQLSDELIQWKDSVQKVSSKFLSKMDKYVENLKH